MLDVYWGLFPVSLPPGPSRTRTAVFAQDEAQLSTAEASKRRLRRQLGERVTVAVTLDATFWPAEQMHQKFNLQRVHAGLVGELAEPFADLDAFLASNAAARLNAYVSGFADESALAAAAEELGWEAENLRCRLEGCSL